MAKATAANWCASALTTTKSIPRVAGQRFRNDQIHRRQPSVRTARAPYATIQPIDDGIRLRQSGLVVPAKITSTQVAGGEGVSSERTEVDRSSCEKCQRPVSRP